MARERRRRGGAHGKAPSYTPAGQRTVGMLEQRVGMCRIQHGDTAFHRVRHSTLHSPLPSRDRSLCMRRGRRIVQRPFVRPPSSRRQSRKPTGRPPPPQKMHRQYAPASMRTLGIEKANQIDLLIRAYPSSAKNAAATRCAAMKRLLPIDTSVPSQLIYPSSSANETPNNLASQRSRSGRTHTP